VYLWVVPAKIDGAWEVSFAGDARRIEVALSQQFQKVSGVVRLPGQPGLPLSGGRLRGADMRLALPAGVYGDGPVELVGRISGGTFEGRVLAGERELATFRASKRS